MVGYEGQMISVSESALGIRPPRFDESARFTGSTGYAVVLVVTARHRMVDGLASTVTGSATSSLTYALFIRES